MTTLSQPERHTQNRIVELFQQELDYDYLGNWEYRDNNRNIEPELLSKWLGERGASEALIARVLRELEQAAALGQSRKLYYANRDVYSLLRYGVKVSEGAGEQHQTVWLIDWKNPENNHFAIAEEVSIKGVHNKRPDIVLYVNGIALGVLELKRSSTSVSEGIRQNLDNQKSNFIQPFFTTMQLVMAGNDSQGLRYGTIQTSEKYYLEWKEEVANPYSSPLDFHLSRICNKQRFLQIIHDFIVFDAGVKKLCRHNQFFGVEAAKEHVARREGGIIWHTQGSGKSLTMVWLAKWIRENVKGSRVLVITDRTELDEQIEKVFNGVNEDIYRTQSGADLIATLNNTSPWLMCSLVHKFGVRGGDDESARDDAADEFVEELAATLPADFKPKGELFVFVDECHRTQSGKLHQAMKAILPEAVFIGFTGTPLLKKDKKKSIEVFGGYIHTYKFNEAVSDGVVLDLRYEARDIDQYIKNPKRVDEWFDAKTDGLTDVARTQLKKKWGTMQAVLSSRSRLSEIVSDVLMDMELKPRLKDGSGNAMLVCSSVYQACTVYDMFSKSDLAGKVAIITSYQPHAASIKGEETGEGETEELFKYDTYRRMIANYYGVTEDKAAGLTEQFEADVKKQFIDEPGQMKLLIVVDKLLTGFDAPSATYLYIDKNMADHNLFQAICSVNRLDGDGKSYGYIIDYKDLFKSLESAVDDYTKEAFEGYDEDDIAGLLENRLEKAKEDLDAALEQVHALCEPVPFPKEVIDYQHYFIGVSGENAELILEQEALRLSFYTSVSRLVRCYMELANEMLEAGYAAQEAQRIKKEVADFQHMRDSVKLASGDHVDLKRFEPAMRRLMDEYIQADNSESLIEFEELGLLEVLIRDGVNTDQLPEGLRQPDAMAEAIENNVRRTIVENNPINPKYYEQMSVLLDELIEKRREDALAYQEYLEKILSLARQVKQPEGEKAEYPTSIASSAQRALYDNLQQDEELTVRLHSAILDNLEDGVWGNTFKRRRVINAVRDVLPSDADLESIMGLVEAQPEYNK